MADMLVTPVELASFLQMDLDTATATLVIELATGKVQAAAGQLLVAGTATAVIDVDICDWGPWLGLPQSPVRAVASVLIDGVVTTDFYLRSQRLWRLNGWNTNSSAPTQVTIEFDYGHLAGAQALEPARGDVLVLCAMAYGNPSGASAEQIDDYRISYAEADARMQVPDGMRDRLRATYGTTAYVTG